MILPICPQFRVFRVFRGQIESGASGVTKDSLSVIDRKGAKTRRDAGGTRGGATGARPAEQAPAGKASRSAMRYNLRLDVMKVILSPT